jgi:predicted phage terminase large subunit-like protein
VSSPAFQFTGADVRAAQCELARRHLSDFCGLIEIPGAPIDDDSDAEDLVYRPIERPQAIHHRLLIEKLEAVERGDVPRLMVFMPPGSAKSSYASVVFPVWFMGRKRRRNVIVATYASPLARKIGRRARSILKQPVYREVFGTGLSADSSAADEWALDNENEFMGGGVLAGITGNRADLIIIDDPIKGRQEADSETIRERTKAEYQDSILTRLKPGGRIVLIQTRWHADDLAGSILPEDYDGESGPVQCRDGQVWEVLRIPAEADRADDPLGRKIGEMLWPEWFGPDHWTPFRAVARTWAALFQQNPTPGEGTYFYKAWFNGGEVEIPGSGVSTFERRRYRPGTQPKHLRKYITSDHAPTDGEDSDPNVARVWGMDAKGDLWLLDGFNAVQKMDKTADAIIGLIKAHEPFAWFPEGDNNFKAAEPFIVAQMRARQAKTRIEPISPHGADKPTKAQSFQGMCAMQMVWIPEGPMGDAIIEEYARFPAGAHDEEIDCGAIMGLAISMAHPAIIPPEDKAPEKPKGIMDQTWDEMLASQQPASGRIG